LQIADRRSQIADRRSQIADRRSQIADRRSQIADRRSQIADRRSQIADRIKKFKFQENAQMKTLFNISIIRTKRDFAFKFALLFYSIYCANQLFQCIEYSTYKTVFFNKLYVVSFFAMFVNSIFMVAIWRDLKKQDIKKDDTNLTPPKSSLLLEMKKHKSAHFIFGFLRKR
jgi:hypothetical protein